MTLGTDDNILDKVVASGTCGNLRQHTRRSPFGRKPGPEQNRRIPDRR
ncbi:hypothetical protein [Larkinella humicola]|nr:hypothetical protein [Larkinella humicola]